MYIEEKRQNKSGTEEGDVIEREMRWVRKYAGDRVKCKTGVAYYKYLGEKAKKIVVLKLCLLFFFFE